MNTKPGTETFYQCFVTRGNSTFAYSAEEYETYADAEDEARRLFGLGEPHVGIYMFTRTVTREHVKGLTPPPSNPPRPTRAQAPR